MLLNLVGGGQNSEDISEVSGQTESLEKPDAPNQYEPVTGTEEPKGQPECEEQSKPAVKKKITILMVGNSMTVRKGNTTIKNLRNMAKKSGQKVVIKYLKSNDEKMKNWANPRHKSGKRLYRSIFGKSATGIKYYGGIGKNLAKKLQKVADKAMN